VAVPTIARETTLLRTWHIPHSGSTQSAPSVVQNQDPCDSWIVSHMLTIVNIAFAAAIVCRRTCIAMGISLHRYITPALQLLPECVNPC
jgi:hypothetical protein